MQLKHPENNHPKEKEKYVYMYVFIEDTNAHLSVTWLKIILKYALFSKNFPTQYFLLSHTYY